MNLPTFDTRLPRRRFAFRLRTLLWLPVAAAALIVCMTPSGPWVGIRSLTIRFLVVDEATGRPIPNARVLLLYLYTNQHEDDQKIVGETGTDGRVALTAAFKAHGAFGLGGETCLISLSPWSVRVEAEGYRTFPTVLDDPDHKASVVLSNPPLGLSVPLPKEVKIALRRAEPEEPDPQREERLLPRRRRATPRAGRCRVRCR